MVYDYPLNSSECKSYSPNIEDYNKLTREDKKLLLQDIKEFTKYVYYFLNLPHPTRDQLYMSEYVGQTVNTTDRLMLQALRSLAKSLTSQILVIWLLLRNKEEKIAVLSATSSRSISWTTFCLNLIRMLPLAQHLYPNTSQRAAADKFDINGCLPSDSPSVGAYSITGQKTGMRATFLIYDDVEIPENSDTAGKREKLGKGIRDATNLGIAHVYRSLALCTPQSSETVYTDMIDRGFKRTVIPAEYPDKPEVYGGDLAPHIFEEMTLEPSLVGKAVDKRLNDEYLTLKKLELTKAEYKLQFMLDTSLSDEEKYPLKLNDLIVMDCDIEEAPLKIEYGSEKHLALYEVKHSGFPNDKLYSPRYVSNERKKYEGIAMFIDPSGRGTDETAYCVTAQLNGKIFLLDFGGLKGGYDIDTLVKLALIAKQYKVNIIQIESNFGDGSFHQLMKPVLQKHYVYGENHGCAVEDVRAVGNKERRIIETLEPIINQHRLIVDKRALERDYNNANVDYRFTYQLTHLTAINNSLKHDDRVDAVEMGVRYWKESLARDEDKAIERHRVDELQSQLKELALKIKKNRGIKEKPYSSFSSF